MSNKILKVKNLTVSFRTRGGTVKAVRDISFDLERGETLAIVGESGSGKSVTSKAIMGILAGNALVEGGEILYGGRDLLRVTEEEMCKLRGDRIAMIFQDPLSSLDPIVKIGKQITEAMLIKGRANRKRAQYELNYLLEHLKSAMLDAVRGDCFRTVRAGELMEIFEDRCKNICKNFEASLGQSDSDGIFEAFEKYMDDDFISEFNIYVEAAVKYSAERSIKTKLEAVERLEKAREYFSSSDNLGPRGVRAVVEELCGALEDTVDELEYNKDNILGSFTARLKGMTHKRAAFGNGELRAWRETCISAIEDIEKKFKEEISAFNTVDFEDRARRLVEHLVGRAFSATHTVTRSMAKENAIRLMEDVGIPDPRTRYDQYPFEFSGGMRQRIVIAIALVANPDILICDEPTTALDVTIQAQILELIDKLKRERGLSIIFITHDLGVVANVADKIAVMYAGKIVEYGSVEDVFCAPAHPYTWALLSSMPDLDTVERLEAIPGTPPDMLHPPRGDAFAARNKYALKIDFEEQPPQIEVSEGHWAATWLLHPNAPRVEPPRIVSERIKRMRREKND